MAEKTKYWKDMELEEFVDDATRYVHTKLLENGGKGLRQAIREIIINELIHPRKPPQ